MQWPLPFVHELHKQQGRPPSYRAPVDAARTVVLSLWLPLAHCSYLLSHARLLLLLRVSSGTPAEVSAGELRPLAPASELQRRLLGTCWHGLCGAAAWLSAAPDRSSGHSRARSSVLTRPLTAAICLRRATSWRCSHTTKEGAVKWREGKVVVVSQQPDHAPNTRRVHEPLCCSMVQDCKHSPVQISCERFCPQIGELTLQSSRALLMSLAVCWSLSLAAADAVGSWWVRAFRLLDI